MAAVSPVKCTNCGTEFFIFNSDDQYIKIECPECKTAEELPNMAKVEETLYTIEDIQEHYVVVSNFNNQLLCEEKETEKLVSFLNCGENKYRMLG